MMNHPNKHFIGCDELLDALSERNADSFSDQDEGDLASTLHPSRIAERDLAADGRGSIHPRMTTNQRRILFILITSLALLLLGLAFSKSAEMNTYGAIHNREIRSVVDYGSNETERLSPAHVSGH